MAALAVTPANVLASAAAIKRLEFNFGYAAATAGQFVFLNGSSVWMLVDSDAGLGTGVNDLRGITLNGGGIGQPAAVCTSDVAFTPGVTMTAGITIYGSATPGGVTMADIPATPAVPIVVGIAKTTTVMSLNPFTTGVAI